MGEHKIKHRAVFLDRDGVLNRAPVHEGKPYAPNNLQELEILPDVAGAMQRLHKAGFKLFVVSNQPDVARGLQKRAAVEKINAKLLSCLPIDGFQVCYHDDGDECACRKPKPGLLLQAAKKYDVVLKESFMIGDRWRDVEAGRNAGCKTIFIDYRYTEVLHIKPDYCTCGLAEAADWIFKQKGELNERHHGLKNKNIC